MTDVLGALLPAAVGALFLVLSVRLGVGSVTQPGPGLWPFIVSLLITVLSGGLLVQALLRPVRGGVLVRGAGKPAAGFALVAAYALVMGRIGYLVSTVALLAVWIRFIGGRPWRTAVLVAVLAAAASYVVFRHWLGVPLPAGVLG